MAWLFRDVWPTLPPLVSDPPQEVIRASELGNILRKLLADVDELRARIENLEGNF